MRGCASSRYHLRSQSRPRRTRSPRRSRPRSPGSGASAVSPNAPPRSCSGRRRRSYGAWKTRATCRACGASRVSRPPTATSSASSSRDPTRRR